MNLLLLTATAALAADEEASGFTLREIGEHSGWLARGVIIMLIVMMLASIFVTIERLLHFRSARNQSMDLAAQVIKHRDVLKAQNMLGWTVFILKLLHKDNPRLLADYLYALAIAKCTGTYRDALQGLLKEVIGLLHQVQDFGDLYCRARNQLESIYS